MDRFWPERIAIFLAMLLACALFLLGVGSPTAGSGPWLDAFAAIFFRVGFEIIGPAWLLMRGFDFCFLEAGRNRR